MSHKFEIASKSLKLVLDSLKECNSQVDFIFRKQGMYTQSSDINNIMLASVFLDRSYFITYSEIKSSDEIKLNIDIETFLKSLKSDTSSNVIIETNGKDIFIIKISGKVKSSFEFNIIQSNNDLVETTEDNNVLSVCIVSSIFKQIVNALSGFSIKCSINFKEDKILFSCKEKSVNAKQEIITTDDSVCKGITFVDEKNVSINLNLDNLISITKSTGFSDSIMISVYKYDDKYSLSSFKYLKDDSYVHYFVSTITD